MKLVLPTVYDDSAKTCASCRHASTEKQKTPIGETGFDDQIMFEDADKDQTVYTCRAPNESSFEDEKGVLHMSVIRYGPNLDKAPHSGKTIGLVPITCVAWEAPQTGAGVKSARLAELDRMIAERDARNKGKE